jgi:hypothetical protein
MASLTCFAVIVSVPLVIAAGFGMEGVYSKQNLDRAFPDNSIFHAQFMRVGECGSSIPPALIRGNAAPFYDPVPVKAGPVYVVGGQVDPHILMQKDRRYACALALVMQARRLSEDVGPPVDLFQLRLSSCNQFGWWRRCDSYEYVALTAGDKQQDTLIDGGTSKAGVKAWYDAIRTASQQIQPASNRVTLTIDRIAFDDVERSTEFAWMVGPGLFLASDIEFTSATVPL